MSQNFQRLHDSRWKKYESLGKLCILEKNSFSDLEVKKQEWLATHNNYTHLNAKKNLLMLFL